MFKPRPGESHPNHAFYRNLFPKIVKDIDSIDNNWRMGRHNLQRINCRSENSKGVYCLQYDDRSHNMTDITYCYYYLKNNKFIYIHIELYIIK